MWTEIAVAAISVGGALGGIWYGSFLNRRSALDTARQLADLDHHKFAQQRLWEERKSAYERIFAQISIMHGAASLMTYYLFGNDTDPPERYMASDLHKQHEKDFHDAFQNVHVLMKTHALILSDDFTNLHEEWKRELWKGDIDEIEEYQSYMNFDQVMTKYLALFKEIGRREISSS
ncbi:hypothetical protein N6H05_19445 [Sphingobium sp. WTD-1]|uniref:hypothetical protein n=1 Tax=Sphingobium sp. WTD-1 TaxID=2979467 RepID=UPI0024DDFC44|nr:hypothetical protein [Sphingobium sp. WTD-1]WIA55185.1 hypothetical protein N6H05_19445 [Sphingobium sp. WTD-1]